jgi:hypothetical protein
MFDTTVTVQRNKTTIRTGLAVRIENMAWKIAADLGGQVPYDSYWIYPTGGGIVDVRRSDLLIDENNIDPLTSQKKQYRVFGAVEQFYSDHAEIPAENPFGS